jgi:ATP-dependent Clp protease adaptor protein ClpS
MARAAELPQVESTEQEQLVPLYRVVLLDDDEHTYDYVIEMLQKLFCMSVTDAYQHAVEVDSTGRTPVITCELPAAEYARDQILLWRGLAHGEVEGLHVGGD